MKNPARSNLLFLLGIFVLISLSCGLSEPTSTATSLPVVIPPTSTTHTSFSPTTAVPTFTLTQAPSLTYTPPATNTTIPSATSTPSPSQTPTESITPTGTPSPTISPTPTITPTPTYSFPRYTALMQANCRYGPGTAYLYAHGLYTGDTGTVWGRTASGTWLWVKPDNIKYQCWIAASVVEVVGDVMALRVEAVRLPHSTFYGPPPWVKAERNGNQVVVSWGRIPMTEDDNNGYLIEANVCKNGSLVWMAVQTYETSYTLPDELTCKGKSNGLLYTVDKHGYSDPIKIPWPK